MTDKILKAKIKKISFKERFKTNLEKMFETTKDEEKFLKKRMKLMAITGGAG